MRRPCEGGGTGEAARRVDVSVLLGDNPDGTERSSE